MGRFIDCQMAFEPWGQKAKFRRAKVGLMRKGSTIYITMFLNGNEHYKLPIRQADIEILPAAIRFKDLQKDLFIRQTSNDQHYSTMMREIKVILRRDELKQKGKGEKFDEFISSIPHLDGLKLSEMKPSQTALRLGDTSSDGSNRSETDRKSRQLAADQRFKACGKSQSKRLQAIKISGLERVPKQLWLNSALHILTLTDCNLTTVPKQLETFAKTLTNLDLSDNKIGQLPRTFCCKMNNLRVLNLSNNLIETLPIEIKFFCRLVDLNVSNNRLRMLPSTFSDLRSLRCLNVANNNLSQLPAFRREDIRLQQLDVSHNPLDGALSEANTFEVHPSSDESLGYNEYLYSKFHPKLRNKFPTLFEISILNIVRCDRLLKLASEESLPRTIVSTMQRDIFKCYKCGQMSILPAYNSADILDYVDQVESLITTGNYRHGMTFMKLLCRRCFDHMSS